MYNMNTTTYKRGRTQETQINIEDKTQNKYKQNQNTTQKTIKIRNKSGWTHSWRISSSYHKIPAM